MIDFGTSYIWSNWDFSGRHKFSLQELMEKENESIYSELGNVYSGRGLDKAMSSFRNSYQKNS